MLMIDFTGLNVKPESFSFYIKKASSSFLSYLVQYNDPGKVKFYCVTQEWNVVSVMSVLQTIPWCRWIIYREIRKLVQSAIFNAHSPKMP